ncbi:MAG: class II aldolase/adducin family protein [Clostridia bacterium]|nr:class II aldolase/adducin family protein [Clostridia bacterium]
MLLKELREQVVYYGRQLLESGLTMHTGGNLSAKDRETGLIAIKPSTMPYDLLRPADITIIDIDGRVVEGNYRPSSEWPMHTLIYRTFPRVCGVVHCHSPYATAAAAAGQELPLITHEICMHCSSPVRVAPFEIPGSEALAQSALRGFGSDNNVALLGNHGSIAMGATLWHAFDGVCAVEQAAQALQLALLYQGTDRADAISPIPEVGRRALRRCDPLQSLENGDPGEIQAV